MLRKLIKLILPIVCLISFDPSTALANQRPSVAFLSPALESSPFFTQSIKIMRAAAADLELDLEVLYGNDDLFLIRETAQALFARNEPPEYLLLVNHRDVTAEVMRAADQRGIKTLLFNGPLSKQVSNEFRYGPKALKHWVGQVMPNDVQSGYLVAQKLVNQARAKNAYDEQGKIQMVGVNGAMRSAATAQRKKGLLAYVNGQDDVQLQQVVHADWHRAEARDKTTKLLQRYADTTVVWTAADHMALGAMDAIEASGRHPGQDIFTAGIDCLPEIFEQLSRGNVTGCAGGHALDAAWAMVIIHDAAHGKLDTFVDERTTFYWADADNLTTMQSLSTPALWEQIDFKKFTKHYNPRRAYNFGASLLVDTSQTALLSSNERCLSEMR